MHETEKNEAKNSFNPKQLLIGKVVVYAVFISTFTNSKSSLMKNLLTILFTATALTALGQANHLVVFSEEGHPFYLIVNGVAQNAKAETSVRVENLTQLSLRLKFIFDDDSQAPADKTITLPDYGREFTYKVKRNAATGDLVTKFMGAQPVPGLLPAQPIQSFTTTQPINQVGVVGGGGATTVTTTTSTTSMQASSTGTSSSFGMSTGGMNMNINVSGVGVNPILPGPTYQEVTTVTQTIHPPQPTTYVMPGYSGPVGCPWPMDDRQVADMKASIASKTWDETRLSQAKTIIANNCLTSAQVRDVVKLMGWEQTRLDLAKFAYGYTFDLGNYYKVNDAFEWEQSITELNQFISGR